MKKEGKRTKKALEEVFQPLSPSLSGTWTLDIRLRDGVWGGGIQREGACFARCEWVGWREET